MKDLSRIFFIYTESSAAVFMLSIAFLEFVCYLFLPKGPIAYLALGASLVFVSVSIMNVLYIIREERKYN